MRTVIVGCGYLGLELGRQLVAAGHDVVGVRRSEDGLDAVDAAGLDPVRADALDPESLESVPDADWLVYAASAGRDGDKHATYVHGLTNVAEAFAARESPPDRFVYTSSTGVYGDREGAWVDEETTLDLESDRERTLVEAERVALDGPLPGTVARLGGIYGPDRHRATHYVGQPVVDGYLNHVRVEDAAGAIAHLLAGDHARGEVVLVVDDEPVHKPELGRWLAGQLDADPPTVRTREDVRADDSLSAARTRRLLADKRCSNERLRESGYEFDYPTYREGYRAIVDQLRESAAADGGVA